MSIDTLPPQGLQGYFLRPLSEARPYPISFATDNEISPIFIGGIVNPNGPTVSLLACVRDRTSAPPALVSAYFNPFRSEVLVPAYFQEGELGVPIAAQMCDALAALEIYSGGAPTLCVGGVCLDEFDVRYLLQRLFAAAPNNCHLLQHLQEFPLNPWDRISAEVQDALAPFSQHDTFDRSRDAGLCDDEMTALLDIVLSAEHNKEELRALSNAWQGSIDQQRRHNNHELADNALQHEDFGRLMAYLLDAAQFVVR